VFSSLNIEEDHMEPKYIVKDSHQGRVLVARLRPEADLILSIKNIAEEKAMKAGVILSGAGLLSRAHIRNCKSLPERYPITDANRMFTVIEKPLEVLAISGIIYTVEGRPNVHAHSVLSFIEEDSIKVVGGHLLEGCRVFGFAEIVIMELRDISLEKTFDSETRTLQLFVEAEH
jgi:hypothetical protein